MKSYTSGKMSIKRGGEFVEVNIDGIVDYSSNGSKLNIDLISAVGAYDSNDENLDLSPSELAEAIAILSQSFYLEEMS